MGTINNYNTVNGINARLNVLDRKEIEINKELRDIQLKLNEMLPENERVKVKKNYFDDLNKDENELYTNDDKLKNKSNNERIIKINNENMGKIMNKNERDKLSNKTISERNSSSEISSTLQSKNKKKKKKSKFKLEKERINNELREKEKKLDKEIKENIIKQDLYEGNLIKEKKEKKIMNEDLYNEKLNKKIDFESKIKEEDLKIINSKKKNPYEENEDYKIIKNLKKGEPNDSISSSDEEPDLEFNFFKGKNEPEETFSEKSQDSENPYFI